MVELSNALVTAGGGFKGRPKVVFLGDSLTANGLVSLGGQNQWRPEGFISWTRWLTGQRIDTSPSLVFATGGYTTAQLLATHVPSAVAAEPGIAVVCIGTNDISATALTDTLANLDEIYTTLNDAGIAVVAVPLPPRASSGATTAGLRKRGAINNWIAERARVSPGVIFANPIPDMVDFSTGYAKSGMLIDDVHLSPTGAQMVGRAIATAINSLLPAMDTAFAFLGDTFSATDNPTGNLLINGLLSGTAGTVSAPTTGTMPSNWRSLTNAATTVTAAFAKSTHATYSTLDQSEVTLGGTADGNYAYIMPSATVDLSGVTAGDRLVARAMVEWSGLANISAIELQARVSDGAATLHRSYDCAANTSVVLPAAQTEIMLQTTELVLPSGFNTPVFNLAFRSATGGGSVSGTVKVNRIEWRKLPA